MAYDENQTFVPESFIHLFRDERQRLTTSREEIAARHEFCEDMANMLVEHCRTVHSRDGVDGDQILNRCNRRPGARTDRHAADQAWWTIRRTAELLGWDWESEEPHRSAG